MSGLTEAEADTLRLEGCPACGGRPIWCPTCEDRLDATCAAVEQIVAARVARFKADAAAAIERPAIRRGTEGVEMRAYISGLADASGVVFVGQT
jgi:hypothetical protein